MNKTFVTLLFSLAACALPGIAPLAQAAPASPVTHIVWTNTDGRLSLWNYTDNGAFTQANYGPYAGWSVKAIADGPDGRQRVLWTNKNGSMSIWSLDNATGQFTQNSFGPYAGWSALDLSVAPGLINHTQLASDPASLAQVSGGLLSTNDNWHVNVKNDLIVKGTVIALQGSGGGIGNNSGQGRALVDGGAANNLIINYANDFGRVSVQSELDVNGSINANSESHFSRGIYSDPRPGTPAGLKVSGGLTSDSLFVSSYIQYNGTDFAITGRGGGVGNNGGAGRALVDAGSDGLYVNYANDFGRVVLNSDAVVTGILTAKSLQLTGGSDLAEPYTIASAADTQPLPGMVVAIDPDQIGRMRVCAHAYDTTVGGIISGAGGVQPGITLRQKGTVADGTLPIACTGRVWCWCDADAGGAISPGDLLTTADTPGHAMRVRDYNRAQGAVLGKAMSSLKTGKGLVLVLVTLQ